MPLINGCCCFLSLKTGCRAAALFTLLTAIFNIAIDISGIIKLFEIKQSITLQEQFLYVPPGYLAMIFVELVLNIIMIPMAFVLLIGINFSFEGRKMLFTWIGFMVIDRIYEIILGVYLLAWIGGHRFDDVIYVVPVSIVVAVYWVLNTLILLTAVICVVSYWQELKDVLFGKERRLKYYNKLSNIRQAALSSFNTPYNKSFYASKSMLSLSQSQMSLDR